MSDDRTKWFREAKFGMFIHWGIYALLGRGEWVMHVEQIPVEEYEPLMHQFRAERFDPDEWMALAKEAGMRYVVMTTKHHDGFCMFDTKLTDYKVTNTPFGRDAIREVTEAARRRGLKMGFYYSILDWHHPDYLPRREWDRRPTEGCDFSRYIEYMRGQIRELLTNYGDIHILWWDGGWEHSPEELGSAETNRMARELQPHILINNRAGVPEDFDTPEQYIPATGLTDEQGRPRLWEVCMTMTSRWWGYDRFEREFKSPEFLIRALVDIVSKGGNLLLNVGPKPDGTIQREFRSRLRAIGRWMSRHGEAIYGTTASPFPLLPFWGRATVKGETLYLFVFDWPPDGTLLVPGLKNRILKARALGTKKRVRFERAGNDWLLRLPPEPPDPVASVVALNLDGEPDVEPLVIRPDEAGVVHLPALYAQIHGRHGQRLRHGCLRHVVHVENWTNPNDFLVWEFELPKSGEFVARATYSCAPWSGGSVMVLSSDGSELEFKVRSTGGWRSFREVRLGKIRLKRGTVRLTLKAASIKRGEAMRLRGLRLYPAS